MLDNLTHLPFSACNCIKIADGKLIGYNTDIVGFEKSLTSDLQPYHRHALVLGKGGASEAVHWVLDKLGIGFTPVSRRTEVEGELKYGELNEEIIHQHQFIINSTPVGTCPHVENVLTFPMSLWETGIIYSILFITRPTLIPAKRRTAGRHYATDQICWSSRRKRAGGSGTRK